MKIALIGYGKMGRAIERLASARGHHIVSKIDPKELTTTITADSLAIADIAIDFSSPKAVMENIERCSSLGKNLVIGSTGWYDQITQAKKIIEKYGTGVIYSPNFSIGVYIFLKLVEEAGRLINPHKQYDIGGFEAHHAQKIDSPSGTAKEMLERILKNVKRKKREEISLNAMRVGSIPGEHTMIFDSPEDTLEIKHIARSREGFAHGALTAGEWLIGKKGFFTLDDWMNSK